MDAYGELYNGQDDIEGKILALMKEGGIKDNVRTALKNGFASAMSSQVVILDRKTRVKLFARTASHLLEEMITELNTGAE